MKMMKYKLLGFLFMFSGIIYASDADNPSQIDEMHLQKWKILVSEAQLTELQTLRFSISANAFHQSVTDYLHRWHI